MALKHVQYQEDTLDALRRYLALARTDGPKAAFGPCTENLAPGFKRDYWHLSDSLADAPFVCLRLPTGGGKTLLASRAIPIAGREFLDQDYPLVLWLVPTKTIRDQTYKALSTPGDIHHEALDAHFQGRFQVLKVTDFDQLRPHDLGNRANIIVSTIATARVDNTEIRKVYAHNENLEPFFSSVPADADLERDEKRKGKPIKFSFANLLRICRPLVIVDEAHNNKSDLSTEVMGRIHPSCIIEFTATPAKESNLLYHVSASELFAEHMIKLPIELTQHATWQEAVHNAVQERLKLDELAQGEVDYIRPIVLIQAENIDKDVTWEIVLEHLEKDEGIPRERIAVATGKERELDDVNLFSRDCPIEYVITVKALKEGWDCSFAYIFCSVATVHSKTEVEQILGRVLRMPYAERRTSPALNRAYAHVSSVSWPAAVQQMRDRLVDMGFDEVEAEAAIQEQRPKPPPQIALQYPSTDPTAGLPLFEIAVREKPDLSDLVPEETAYVTVTEHEEGLTTLTVDENIPEATLKKVEQQLDGRDRKALRETLAIRRRQREREHAPARQGKRFRVPQLCRSVQGDLELVEHETLVGPEGWQLDQFPATLSPSDFATDVEAKRYELTIEGKRVTQRFLGAQMTLDLKNMEEPWTQDVLIDWLDRHLQDPTNRVCADIRQAVMRKFVRGVVTYLMQERRLTLGDLQLYCFPLQKAIEKKIVVHRQAAFRKGFQQLLRLPEDAVRTDFDTPFEFPSEGYQPHWFYQGSRRFNRHFYPAVGELKSKGEEFDCAVAIDESPAVAHWVRNLDHGDACFRLPRSSGYFYPDFVAELTDGRVLVIEYKGEHLEDKQSEQEKRDIGRLWEERSGGRALFLWAVRTDDHGQDVRQQIAAIAGV